MYADFSWLTNFNFGIYFNLSSKKILVPQVPVSQEQQLKLYQRRFDANKKAIYHRQQKK